MVLIYILILFMYSLCLVVSKWSICGGTACVCDWSVYLHFKTTAAYIIFHISFVICHSGLVVLCFEPWALWGVSIINSRMRLNYVTSSETGWVSPNKWKDKWRVFDSGRPPSPAYVQLTSESLTATTTSLDESSGASCCVLDSSEWKHVHDVSQQALLTRQCGFIWETPCPVQTLIVWFLDRDPSVSS